MNDIWDFISNQYEWIFSGIGVYFISGIVAFIGFIAFRKWRKKMTNKEKNDIIITHGNQSPGKVGGNYEVNINEQKKSKD